MVRTPIGLLLDEYDDFLADGMKALSSGDNEYSGSAESRMPSELIREVLEECVDASVWSYLTYRRVKSLAKKIGRLESVMAEDDDEAEDGENYIAIATNKHGQYIGPGAEYDEPCCRGKATTFGCGCSYHDDDE